MLGVLAFILLAGYLYFQYFCNYWTKKEVPSVPAILLLRCVGDVVFQRRSFGEAFTDIYRQLEGHSFGMIYAVYKPLFVVRDPELIKDIMVKNFNHFQDHGAHCDEKDDPLSANLFFLKGERWRRLRMKLTPTFTSGKLKMMFPILVECTQDLLQCLEEPARNGSVIEFKEILACYTTDIIASCAFGIQCNCLKNPEAEFRNWGRKIFEPSLKAGVRDFFMFAAPPICSLMKIPFVPKDVERYFCKMVQETINYRKTNNIKRNDFMQLMMQLMDKIGEDGLTLLEVAAQAFVFFLGGFETSSTTMAFCLYELALNQDVQEKLRMEVDAVLKNHGNKLTYEAIHNMEYLERVIKETLRKHPPVAFLLRQCNKSYCIPGTDVKVEKGASVIFPILGIHHDVAYYSEPDKFDPDRFSTERKDHQQRFTFLPFGNGPRSCIGMLFAMMQIKMGIAALISYYSFQICDDSPVPLILNPKTILRSPTGGMNLKILQRPT